MTTCPNCKKAFKPPAKKLSQKYCCRECWRQSKYKQVEHVCNTCGKIFSVHQARSNAKYCSVECRKQQAKKTCEYCGTTYYVKQSHSSKRKTCSRSCLAKLKAAEGKSPRQGQEKTPQEKQNISEGLQRYYGGHPERHWNYQHGPFSELRGNYTSWQHQRIKARNRDNFTCKVCGITEAQLPRQLSVHHIKPFRFFSNPQDANHLDNLISTCQSCHMKLEHNTISLPE